MVAEGLKAKPEGLLHNPEGCVAWWTPELVEERLIEAWGYLRRMPGGGRSPFATDGPWSQSIREWGDWGAHDHEEVRERESRVRGGLNASEVDRMTEALAWVELMRPRDVKLVGLVLRAIDRSGSRVAWGELSQAAGQRNRLGRLLGGDALRMRYERALATVAQALNRPRRK